MTPSPLLLKAVRESRMDIAQEYVSLCEELDFQKKFKHSFKQHPFLWLGGAASAGLLTTIFGKKGSPSRTASQSPSPSSARAGAASTLTKVGWWAGVLEIGKFLYPIVRPHLMDFASNTVQRTIGKKTGSP